MAEAPPAAAAPEPPEEEHRCFDWEAFLEGCRSCVVYCHGGCPDGLGAARLTTLALDSFGRRSEIIELEHTDRADKAVEFIGPEVAVLYVDISPHREDLPLLRLARRVLVVDHHASVKDRMAELLKEMPSMIDLSQLEGDHCAASLIGREVGHLLHGVADVDKKIALLRKKDVWHYQIPEEWKAEASAIVAYMQIEPVATMAMIDEFLNDLPACLAKGAKAKQVLQQRAAELFEEVKVLAEADHPQDLIVLGVEQHQELAYDTRHFDSLCRRHSNALVLRANLYKLPDAVDIRLSRTSESVALGSLARQLHEQEPAVYLGGGGHPFAAGLQVQKSGFDIRRVATDLLHGAGAVPSQIARSRQHEALDVSDSPVSSKSPSKESTSPDLVLRRRASRQRPRFMSRSVSAPCPGGDEEGGGDGEGAEPREPRSRLKTEPVLPIAESFSRGITTSSSCSCECADHDEP